MLKKMKRMIVIFLVLTLCSGTTVYGSQETEEKKEPEVISGIASKGGKLIWQDDFIGTGIDRDNWEYEPFSNGYGSGYSYDNSSANFSKVKAGNLVITSQIEYDTSSNRVIDNSAITSRLWTKEKKLLQYGKIEIRAKLPKGKGITSFGYMLGRLDDSHTNRYAWPDCGEIDVFEKTEHCNESEAVQALHTRKNNTMNTSIGAVSKKSTLDTLSSEYHNYCIEWRKDRIDFFIDGKRTMTYDPYINGSKEAALKDNDVWPFSNPFYLNLSCRIGGFNGGEVTPEGWKKISENHGIETYQDYMYIDYVRLYSLADENDTSLKIAKAKIKSAKHTKKNAITVKYKKLKNAKKYQIQYATNRKFKKVVIKTTKRTKYKITKIKKDKTYYIRVRGINGKIKGAWSKTKVIKRTEK